MEFARLFRRFLLAFLTLFISCILSGCGSGTSSSSGNNTAPVSLGVLSNGSTLYTSTNSFPISDAGTTANGILSLVGGTPNASFTINFGASVLQGTQKAHTSSKRLQGADTNGITITPLSCVMGTAGSGNSSECAYTIGAAESTPAGTYSVPVSATDSNGVVQNLGSITVLISGTVTPSSHAITSYSLNGTAGVITGTNIAVEMPFGTNVTALVATYVTTGASVAVGSTTQVNGVTANNFTSPVVYTVTAADGSTQDYTVTVTVAPSSAKAIMAFSLDGTAGVITGNSISVTMPFGTNVTALVATYVTTGSSVKVGSTTQLNGFTANDFTNTVIYTVTAGDGSTQDYMVTVTILPQAWTDVGTPNFSAGGTYYNSIAFNPSTNQPYVVYQDGGSDLKATVMKFEGTTWVNVGTPGFSVASTSYISIAFNPSTNQPYVIYQDGANGNKATVMMFNDTSWVTVGTPGFSAGTSTYNSIAFNPGTNQPYVVYKDGGSDLKATVMKFDGSTWVNIGTPGFSASQSDYTKIAFNPSTNQPYVVYKDAGNNNAATMKTFNGTAWVNVGTPGFSAGAADYTSIAFNPSTNQPYVVYRDSVNDGKATVMTFNGTTWVTVGSPGFSAAGTLFTSIAFNPNTYEPYVVYHDSSDNGKATVMKF